MRKPSYPYMVYLFLDASRRGTVGFDGKFDAYVQHCRKAKKT